MPPIESFQGINGVVRRLPVNRPTRHVRASRHRRHLYKDKA